MKPATPKQEAWQISRRALMSGTVKTIVAYGLAPSLFAQRATGATEFRSINIMNFIRAEEPREPMDLFLPVREQMKLIKAHNFPATWLLQYDALVEGPFVDFLKAEMPPNHEVGLWFEMNRRICDDAGVTWRGKADWEWDYHVPIAYSIGYTPEERRKLADTAMTTFKRVFGRECKSIASWNLDAISVAHLSDHYAIDAFGNCRDQLATDGFTVWGSPIAAYYPNRVNAWSPAVEEKNQIASPIFRLLGQDPVYYYDNQIPKPDTMEPVWPSGRSKVFVDRFLAMIADAPTQSLTYAQLGQENSFGWPEMTPAFPMQMEALARVQKEGKISVETMGETGRRFKHSFPSTPTQAQVMLDDPFGHENPSQRTVWYQSKYYRANLHFVGEQFYLRDLHVYSDGFPQPYLTEPVRQHGIEQRMLALLDGYHWSDDEIRAGRKGTRAQARFMAVQRDGSRTPLIMQGIPTVHQQGDTLSTSVPLSGGGRLRSVFQQDHATFTLEGLTPQLHLGLEFEWVPQRSSFQDISKDEMRYVFRDFAYKLRIPHGSLTRTATGVSLTSMGNSTLSLLLSQ
jgi:hypothetical protein